MPGPFGEYDDADNAAGYDPDPDRDADRYERDLERQWNRCD